MNEKTVILNNDFSIAYCDSELNSVLKIEDAEKLAQQTNQTVNLINNPAVYFYNPQLVKEAYAASVKTPGGQYVVKISYPSEVQSALRVPQFLEAYITEIRNALNNISAANSALKQKCGEFANDYCSIIKKNSNILHKISEDFVESLNIENLADEYIARPVELKKYLRGFFSNIEEYLTSLKVTLSFSYKNECVFAMSEHRFLDRIFVNLVSNALKYQGENKRIEVNLFSKNSTAYVEIKNFGEKIPENIDIFNKYTYSRSLTTNYSGDLGLGLYIARELARIQNGDITAQPDDDGVTFTVSLPAVNKVHPFLSDADRLTNSIYQKNLIDIYFKQFIN